MSLISTASTPASNDALLDSPRVVPRPIEMAVLGALLLAFVMTDLATALWYPNTYMDEVMYTDPSINLYQGRGFTSSAWHSQPSTQFWASNCPLHEVVLYGWICLFGFSALAVRSLNVALLAVSVVLLWLACCRISLLTRPVSRLLLAGLMVTGAGMSYLARFGRPDAITLLLATATLLAYSIRSPRWRSIAIFSLALFYPIAGLQLVAYAVIVCLLLWIFLGRGFFKTGLIVGAGAATGLALLLGFYASKGLLFVFLSLTVGSAHTSVGDLAQLAVIRDAKVANRVHVRATMLSRFWNTYLVDLSYPPLLLGLLLVNLRRWRAEHRLTRTVPFFGLVAGLVIPPFMMLAGKYPFYYTWMGFLPVIICTCRAFEDALLSREERPLRLVLGTLLLTASAVGLPVILSATPSHQRGKFAQIEKFVQSVVRPEDWVYGEASIYYPTKQRASMYFYSASYATGRGLPKFPDSEREKVSVLIIPPDKFEEAAKKVGGDWAATGESLDLSDSPSSYPALVKPLFAVASDEGLGNTPLIVYRRSARAGEPSQPPTVPEHDVSPRR